MSKKILFLIALIVLGGAVVSSLCWTRWTHRTAGPQGPAGPQGQTGPAGPAGPAGPQGEASPALTSAESDLHGMSQ